MVPRFQPPDILSNSYWAVRLPLASCTLINLQKRLTENVSISIHQSILKIMAKKIGTFWIVVQVLLTVLALQNAPWSSLYMTSKNWQIQWLSFLQEMRQKRGVNKGRGYKRQDFQRLCSSFDVYFQTGKFVDSNIAAS